MRDLSSITYGPIFTDVLSSLRDQSFPAQKVVKERECSGLNRFENAQKKLGSNVQDHAMVLILSITIIERSIRVSRSGDFPVSLSESIDFIT
jgi:hypothetical protein